MVSHGSMPDDLASFEGGQRGQAWVNWVMTSNGLRRSGFSRAPESFAAPVLLNSAFSSTSEGAAHGYTVVKRQQKNKEREDEKRIRRIV